MGEIVRSNTIDPNNTLQQTPIISSSEMENTPHNMQ